MSLARAVYGQFKRPHGFLGALAGWIMAHRGSNRARNLWTVSLLDIQPTDRVLEIGFGPGLAIAEAARLATAGAVVGVDHSATMLAQARRRNRAAIGAGRVDLRLGGLESLGELPGPFDKMLSANVAQFWPDAAAAYRAIIAVTAGGGRIATTYMPRHGGATRADGLRAMDRFGAAMADVGFAEIEIAELPLAPMPAFSVLGRRP